MFQGDSIHSQTSLLRDLRELGIKENMTLLVHASLKAIGKVVGGPVAVILALEDAIGANGTLAMSSMTLNLCDPEDEDFFYPEWPLKYARENIPAYRPDLSPTTSVGWIPETFRKQEGVLRSSHPHLSFCARGKHAHQITSDHSFDYALGEDSPLRHIHDLNGHVLMLGAPKNTNTMIHLAEYRQAEHLRGRKDWRAPVLVHGIREWKTYRDIYNHDDDFNQIHDAFVKATDHVRTGVIGQAESHLMPVRPLVEFAVDWMNKNRRPPPN